MTKQDSEAIWDIFKEIVSLIRYCFLSNEDKFEFNLKQLKEKYWFEQLLLKVPYLLPLIEEDKELRDYLTSRKNVNSLLREKDERKKFKEWLEIKSNNNF
ncbi:hypothetical protein [Paenisporosarcina sp. OV554]|uniref:hypothetical protein n=1 Tax=Paenisporosarcina sp. OV554 TaxID=2135694 RepID=UPI000D350EBC|nr:hypothetical protein [Paenisporosarcina sp. OV554]PUB14555.1 hypothetical protein C8K15_105115 [Paenisporosarcina sp. OV554]